MKAIVILLISCFSVQSGFSQFIENFNDGDFLINPSWKGDTSFFIVNDSNQLQSNGPGQSSEISLNTEYEMSQNSIWEFYARLDFATSTSNHARFYLSADTNFLSGDLNGYYIKLGGESGSDDGIDLYRQEFDNHFKIIDGIPGYFGKDSNEVAVKVSRSFQGEWTLWADTSKNSNYVLQGTTFDNSQTLGKNLGIFCKHSSTRSDKFFFDNIKLIDGPFNLIACHAINDSTIEVLFSNPPDSASASYPNNYFIDQGISSPQTVFSFDSLPFRKFLRLQTKVSAGNYSLSLSNITDRLHQNLIKNTDSFSFYPQAQVSQLIFNEIMYDPSPVVGMPSHEYVEILNIAPHTISLKNLLYSDSNTEIQFPEILLDSGSYLIICDIEDTAEFKWFGNIYGLDTWPSLNNSGDLLTLSTPENVILDQINYDYDWSDGSAKDEGGWAHERINPFKKCTNTQNWTYSVSGAGGTPGQINSVFNPEPDIIGPELDFIEVLSSDYLKLHFNEILNQNQLLIKHLHFEPANQVSSILQIDKSIELSLRNQLDSGEIYTLRFDSIMDCEGNFSSNQSATFGLGIAPKLFELIISEIMYDPEPQNSLPATEYIELNNSSDHIISLNGVEIISEEDTAKLPAISLYPDEYLILCPSSYFEELNEIGKSLKVSPWISLKNDKDEIEIYFDSEIIHRVNYSSDWISDLEKRDGGWSLEIIDPKNPCGEEYNWNASLDWRGGTPGMINSIAASNLDLQPAHISSIDIIDDNQIKIRFNELMDFKYLHLKNLLLEPAPDITYFNYDKRLSKQLDLHFSDDLKSDINYNVILKQMKDCSNNYADLDDTFLIPENPENQDLVINEILFNSPTGVSEYVELYNRSPKNISLENVFLGYYASDSQLKSMSKISHQIFILKAFEFLVLCEDSNSIISHFPKRGKNYLEISGFPSLNNTSGILSLLDSGLALIDSASYSEDLHFELIEDEKGVALERLSTEISGNKNDNWTSAAETYKFGTPGILNSNALIRNTSETAVIIEPELFSPDGDGYKDLLHIHFNTEYPFSAASIEIFNLQGRLIKNLANNSTLAYENDFIWDGISDSGEKAKIGNYIVLIDLFDLDGNRKKIKKIVGLGGRI